MGKSVNINLSKKFYGLKGALSKLDEEFNSFNFSKQTSKEFFELWNRYFYDLERQTHHYFMNKSAKYAYPDGIPTNPRLLANEDLEKEIRSIQKQIDSKEQEHTFFKNNIFLMRNDTGLTTGNLTTTGPLIGPYYIQSGKKRLVDNLDLYSKLKTKTRKYSADISDQNFLVLVNKKTILGIPTGPPITNINDIYIDSLEINIYPQTLEQYNNTPINVLIGDNTTDTAVLINGRN